MVPVRKEVPESRAGDLMCSGTQMENLEGVKGVSMMTPGDSS